jgi:hypothetical protein
MPLPRVLCRGFRAASGAVMACVHPVMEAGEPGGRLVHNAQCHLCRVMEQRASELRFQKECERTAKRLATGKTTVPMPAEIFKGFMEEEK